MNVVKKESLVAWSVSDNSGEIIAWIKRPRNNVGYYLSYKRLGFGVCEEFYFNFKEVKLAAINL